MEKKYTLLQIRNGRCPIYKFYNHLLAEGFEFNHRSYGKSFFEIKLYNETDVAHYQRWCRLKGLRYDLISSDYCRGNNYRENFFKNNPPQKKGWRCAYCGKWLKKHEVTVDHIIPVSKAMNSSYIQKKMKKIGINNINDVKNLCAACKSCNSSKSSKLGSWIFKGRIGRSYSLWKFRIFCRWAVVIGVVILVVKLLSLYFKLF